jgi:hypothetical protein
MCIFEFVGDICLTHLYIEYTRVFWVYSCYLELSLLLKSSIHFVTLL